MRRLQLVTSIGLAAIVLCAAVVEIRASLPPSAFTIVLIPDTQNYNEHSRHFVDDNTHRLTTQFIVDSISGPRVAITLGDITNSNGESSDDADKMWLEASAAYRTLDNANIPYLMVPGNHDHSTINGETHRLQRSASFYNWNFSPFRYTAPWYVGHYSDDPRDNRNSAITFSGAGADFLAIGLDMNPTKDAVCWADDLIRANKRKRVIVATHCYQTMPAPGSPDGTRRLSNCAYRLVGMNGQDLWDELLNLHSNIWLMTSGHIQGGAYHTQKVNDAGGTVNEVLVDYQDERKAPRDNPVSNRKHGNGWIKLLEYDGDKTFNARPVSVLGATKFNIGDFDSRTDNDGICQTTFMCYDSNASSSHHTFPVDFPKQLPPDSHRLPERFTDRTVNEASAGDQVTPDVALTSAGEAMVAWADDSEPPAGQYEIFERNLAATGCVGSHAFRVNVNSRRQQSQPAVAINDAGDVVTVWTDDSHGPEGVYQVYARGNDRHGTQRFFPITVNASAGGSQMRPAVTIDGAGNFAVAWQDSRSDDGDIFLRLFGNAATALSNDILVNDGSQKAGTQRFPKVGFTSDNAFVVVWSTDVGVFGRRIAANGALSPVASISSLLGPEAVAFDLDLSTNEGAVAWAESGRRVRLARFAVTATGVQFLGGVHTVFDAGKGSLIKRLIKKVSVGVTTGGRAMVVWQDDSDANGSTQILGRRMQWLGDHWSPSADEAVWTVNKDCHGDQVEPRVRLASNGHWVVVWTDDLDANGSTQILARGGLFNDADARGRETC